MANRLSVGQAAPEFVLESQTGERVDLRERVGQAEIVLYFYPKDFTPGCTTEARTFRDNYEVFREMGAEVIGISSDSVSSHQAFASKCNLPFTLLSDYGGKVRKLYGVPSSMGFIPGRVTYIIDRKGIVRHIFSSQINPEKHIEEAVRALKAIREGNVLPADAGSG